MSERLSFTVQRSKWLRADNKGQDGIFLCDHDGNKCCLGFFANQICKVSEDDMRMIRAPFGLGVRSDLHPNLGLLQVEPAPGSNTKNSLLAKAAIEYNDNPSIYDSERERRLTDLFKYNGIDVTFVD